MAKLILCNNDNTIKEFELLESKEDSSKTYAQIGKYFVETTTDDTDLPYPKVYTNDLTQWIKDVS